MLESSRMLSTSGTDQPLTRTFEMKTVTVNLNQSTKKLSWNDSSRHPQLFRSWPGRHSGVEILPGERVWAVMISHAHGAELCLRADWEEKERKMRMLSLCISRDLVAQGAHVANATPPFVEPASPASTRLKNALRGTEQSTRNARSLQAQRGISY